MNDSAAPQQYVVVFRSRAAVRLMPEERFKVRASSTNDEGEGIDGQIVYTNWVDVGLGHPAAGDLTLEVRGRALSLERAIHLFSQHVRVTTSVLAFVANVRCEPPEFLVGWLSDDASSARPFAHAFRAGDPPGGAGGRRVRLSLLAAAYDGILLLPEALQGRVLRALWQYDLAIREWAVGSEWRAVSHLWMAAEALTPLFRQRELARTGWTEEQLLSHVGKAWEESDPGRWPRLVDPYCRRELIFAGDKATYAAAKDSSDGLEHGYKDVAEVQRLAVQAASATFAHVRSAMTVLLGLEASISDELKAIQPMDVLSEHHVAHGVLLEPGHPAPEGERYPRLEWRSRISSIVREGESVTVERKREVVIRIREGMRLRLDAEETLGRAEDGGADGTAVGPIEVTHGSARATDLLDAVWQVVTLGAESGNLATLPPFSDIAFKYFGQGLAMFQAARSLCRADQPIEALLQLRNLVSIAALFETISHTGDYHIGYAVRAAMDSFDRDFGKGGHDGADQWGTDLARDKVAEWQKIADEHRILVPAAIPRPQDSKVWMSLGFELSLADQLVDVSYIPMALHVDRSAGGDVAVFRTALEPGPLSDVIASACAIAQLDLYRYAAPIFGWVVPNKLDELMAKAQQMNSAELPIDRSPSEQPR